MSTSSCLKSFWKKSQTHVYWRAGNEDTKGAPHVYFGSFLRVQGHELSDVRSVSSHASGGQRLMLVVGVVVEDQTDPFPDNARQIQRRFNNFQNLYNEI